LGHQAEGKKMISKILLFQWMIIIHSAIKVKE